MSERERERERETGTMGRERETWGERQRGSRSERVGERVSYRDSKRQEMEGKDNEKRDTITEMDEHSEAVRERESGDRQSERERWRE